MSTQDDPGRIVYIPAVPLPLLGWRTDRCYGCGERFRGKGRREAYELHWRLLHEPEIDPAGPQTSVGVPWSEADRIYAAVRRARTAA